MLWRIQPTGNSTFDPIERAAYQTYYQAMANVVSGFGELQAEITYYLSCWLSAITQLGKRDFGSNFSGYVLVGHNTTVPLDFLVKDLATALRTRGYAGLPTSFQVVLGGVVTEATEGTGNAVGDLLTITGGAGGYNSPFVSGIFNVTSVGASGSVEGLGVTNMGLYLTTPSNDVATTTNGGGDNAATVTVTYATLPVEYDF